MLEWHLKYGKKLEFFENLDVEGYVEKDEKLRKVVEGQPSLYEDLYEDWNIFWKLSGKRRFDGMSGFVGPIPYAEIEAYMKIYGITGIVERERLVERIQFLDQIFCEYHNRKK